MINDNKLFIQIHKIKGIQDLSVSLPIDNGIYLLTGENGTYKSTIGACVSMVYKPMPKYPYFGITPIDAKITYELGSLKFSVGKNAKDVWKLRNEGDVFSRVFRKDIGLYVFFEGGPYFGSRFNHLNKANLAKDTTTSWSKLDALVTQEFGYIMHAKKDYYGQTFFKDVEGIKRYRYEMNGEFIEDSHMSTGEILTLKILTAIYSFSKQKPNDRKGLMIIDEVEMGLHSSALIRLLKVLNELAKTKNYAIYLITHSVELIHHVEPNNILYLRKNESNEIECIHPCYPGYASGLLYEKNTFDRIIYVEDEYAKKLIETLISKEDLAKNKRLYIMPIAGWTQVIQRAYEWQENGIIIPPTKVLMILDEDIKESVPSFFNNHSEYDQSIELNFLPIKSIEKYVKKKAYDENDPIFIEWFETRFHPKNTILSINNRYRKKREQEIEEARKLNKTSSDANGKSYCTSFVQNVAADQVDLFVGYLLEYLYTHEKDRLNEFKTMISNFLE